MAVLSMMAISPNHITIMSNEEISLITFVFKKFKLSFWDTLLNTYMEMRNRDCFFKNLSPSCYKTISTSIGIKKLKGKFSQSYDHKFFFQFYS